MARYISVETTIDDLHTVDPQYQKVVDWCIRVIEAQPAADVAPVRRGEWIEKQVIDGKIIEQWQSAKCSKCGKYHTTPYMYFFDNYAFCPACGAKMEASDEEG